MTIKLFIQAITKFIFGFILLGVLLFLSAWTFDYPSAWLFLGLLFVPMLIAGIVMMVKNPQLLKKRLNAKEKDSEQKTVVLLSGIMFIGGFVVSALDFRFSWLIVPNWVIVSASFVFLFAYALYAEVLRENTYLSRTIEVQENQKVIDTGLYGVVRHPMYMATVLLFISIPFVLGSLIAAPIFFMYPFIIVKRIKNEEQFLEKELKGYSEYKQKVKYRLIPFVW